MSRQAQSAVDVRDVILADTRSVSCIAASRHGEYVISMGGRRQGRSRLTRDTRQNAAPPRQCKNDGLHHQCIECVWARANWGACIQYKALSYLVFRTLPRYGDLLRSEDCKTAEDSSSGLDRRDLASTSADESCKLPLDSTNCCDSEYIVLPQLQSEYSFRNWRVPMASK